MTRARCTAPNEGVVLSQTLTGTATCTACTCAPVAASGPPALGPGCALGRHPPPAGSVCMRMGACTRAINNCQGLATAGPESQQHQGPPFNLSVLTPRSEVSKTQSHNGMGQRRCMMTPKPTKMSPRQGQRDQQQPGPADMSKLLRGPVSPLLFPPPHLHGNHGTRHQHRHHEGCCTGCLSRASAGRPAYAEAVLDIGQRGKQPDSLQYALHNAG